MKRTLTLAGSDSSGGAGIQADLKTFQENDVYGMTALTSIVTMDPDNNWSHGVFPIDVNIVEKHVIIKGGTGLNMDKAVDLFYDGQEFTLLEEEKLDTTYNHGAGCTFSAAITANLANGKSVKDSVAAAKEFVTAAIKHGWKLNEYVGPVMHGAYIKYVGSLKN